MDSNYDGKPCQTLNRRRFLTSTAGLATTALIPRVMWGQEKTTPMNVVFFLVDDMGWMDSSVYGSRYYETPNLERLARISMRFTNAYSAAPLCTATRASIMTGKYPGRLHITGASGHLPDPPNPGIPESGPPHQEILAPPGKGTLPLEEYTLGEALHDAGYKTCFIGKWHLGPDPQFWPEHQGFDINIGGGPWPGPPSYFSPYHISNLPDGPEGEYIADRLTDEAIKFIDDTNDQPFFLNLWQYAIHAPYQGKVKYREQFEKKEDARGAQENAVMAAMIKSMDESLGRILDKLETDGLMRNTIIIFTSDNGGNMYDHIGQDGSPLPAGRTPTNNAPLRSGKASVYEGGIRVPALIYCPGVVESEAVSHQVINSIDYYPTLLELLDIPRNENQIMDGISIVPALQGKDLNREAIFGHFPHHIPLVPCQMASWVRAGDWKLIRFYQQDEIFPDRIELYNLKEDIAELHNLAEREPDLVAKLESLLDQHLLETGAEVPRKNPNYDPDFIRITEGWIPKGTCTVQHQEGRLLIHSTGGDPFILNSSVPEISGKLSIQFRMKSNSNGIGQFFWTTDQIPNMGPQQRLDFNPVHDGTWEEFKIPFEAASSLKSIRIDPSAAPGVVELDWVKLVDEKEAVVRQWNFGE